MYHRVVNIPLEPKADYRSTSFSNLKDNLINFNLQACDRIYGSGKCFVIIISSVITYL